MLENNQPSYYHITTSDGIHLFQFNELTPLTIDRWIDVITPVYTETPPTHLLRVCLDFAVPTLQHLTYGFHKMRTLLESVSDKQPYARYALLHEKPSILTVCSSLVQLTPKPHKTTLRFFYRQNYEAAFAWLLTVD